MSWQKEYVRRYTKAYFEGVDEPLCVIISEPKSYLFGQGARLSIDREGWQEIGRIMGWKQ